MDEQDFKVSDPDAVQVTKKCCVFLFFSPPNLTSQIEADATAWSPVNIFCPRALTLTSREMCEPVRQNNHGLTELRQVVRLPRKRTRLF